MSLVIKKEQEGNTFQNTEYLNLPLLCQALDLQPWQIDMAIANAANNGTLRLLANPQREITVLVSDFPVVMQTMLEQSQVLGQPIDWLKGVNFKNKQFEIKPPSQYTIVYQYR